MMSTSAFTGPEEVAIATLKGHEKGVETLDFNPTAPNELLSGSHDTTVRVWDLNKNVQTGLLKGHKEGVWCVRYHQDGNTFVTCSPDQTVLIWDKRAGKVSSTLKGHTNKVYWATWNEDSTTVASCGSDSAIIIWDLKKMTPKDTPMSDSKIVYCCEYTKDKSYLIASEYGGSLKVYDTRLNYKRVHASPIIEPDLRAYMVAVDFRPTSKVNRSVFVACEDHFIRKFDWDERNSALHLHKKQEGHYDAVKCVTLDTEKNLLLSGCKDGSVKIWEPSYMKYLKSLVGHRDSVSSVASSKTLIAAGSWDQTIMVYKN